MNHLPPFCFGRREAFFMPKSASGDTIPLECKKTGLKFTKVFAILKDEKFTIC
jgi:hypothetical protein